MGKPLHPDFKYEMVFTYRCLGVKQKDIGKMTGRDQASVSRFINFIPTRPHCYTKEQQREYKREWQKNNPDKVRAGWQRYQAENKELCKERSRLWQKANRQRPEIKAAKRTHDKARKYKIRDEMPCPLVKAIYLLTYNLTQATGIQYVADHIQPLCAGGEHAAYNLQVIPQDQNATKSGKWGVAEQAYFCNGLFD